MNLITRNGVKYEEVAYYSNMTQSYFAFVKGVIVKITDAEFEEICRKENLIRIPFDKHDTKQHYILYGLQINNQ